MSFFRKIRTVLRGDIPPLALPRELFRRQRAAVRQRRERLEIDAVDRAPARLAAQFASLSGEALLRHFRERKEAVFALNHPSDPAVRLQRDLFPDETEQLLTAADQIVRDNSWELCGFGLLRFGTEDLWRIDPLGTKDWGLDYHADVLSYSGDTADIRVLWELNRFGHALTLARAYVITGDERFAETYFSQIEDWMSQNPYGRGANWNCAMEVALRAINLLAAFDIFRSSSSLTASRLLRVLQLFDQHGKFILDNNEFSYIATSNHYLSNVVGLFWIGTLLPELKYAGNWKDFGFSEMLNEVDKQVLADGANFEASSGYHKFVTELLLYSFLIGRQNGVDIPDAYWGTLHKMFDYIFAILRPDGRVPLIGDADGSRVAPLVGRDADDQAYLLALGAVVFERSEFKTSATVTPEILWVLGHPGINTFNLLNSDTGSQRSAAFALAGSYVMRSDDLYLHVNTNDCGLKGRGSHAHNDALSIEVSAHGRPFIVDPGSYAYNLDRDARHTFRSTAYHSTVLIDNMDQNSTDRLSPFVIGNEGRPRVISWESDSERDRLVAQHAGYARLQQPVRHIRAVEFNKKERYWTIEDSLTGAGSHSIRFIFHLAPGLHIQAVDDGNVLIGDDEQGLYVSVTGIVAKPAEHPGYVSRNYGHRERSAILSWELSTVLPVKARFTLRPSPRDETAGTSR